MNLFDENQGSFIGESEVIKQFNQNLQEDPSFILPEGYTKVQWKEIHFNYALRDDLKIKESFKNCFLILNDVLNEIGVQMIEPTTMTTTTTRAVAKMNAGLEV